MDINDPDFDPRKQTFPSASGDREALSKMFETVSYLPSPEPFELDEHGLRIPAPEPDDPDDE